MELLRKAAAWCHVMTSDGFMKMDPAHSILTRTHLAAQLPAQATGYKVSSLQAQAVSPAEEIGMLRGNAQ